MIYYYYRKLSAHTDGESLKLRYGWKFTITLNNWTYTHTHTHTKSACSYISGATNKGHECLKQWHNRFLVHLNYSPLILPVEINWFLWFLSWFLRSTISLGVLCARRSIDNTINELFHSVLFSISLLFYVIYFWKFIYSPISNFQADKLSDSSTRHNIASHFNPLKKVRSAWSWAHCMLQSRRHALR